MIALEKMPAVEIDEMEVKFFLEHLKRGRIQDLTYKRALIAIFINKVYLYDDGKARIIFNATDRPVEIDFDLLNEIESLENGASVGGGRCSYMMNTSPNNKNPVIIAFNAIKLRQS